MSANYLPVIGSLAVGGFLGAKISESFDTSTWKAQYLNAQKELQSKQSMTTDEDKNTIAGLKKSVAAWQTRYNNLVKDTSTWNSGDHCIIKDVFDSVGITDEDMCKSTATGWNLDKATISARAMKQHVGVYAGDDESYSTFSKVFDEVIKIYHNVDVKTNKAKPEDYKPKSPRQLPPEGQKAIISTRIRTARNFKGYPFTNNMSKEQRLEIEQTLSRVFEGFTDERLKGTYYSIASLTPAEQKKLIDAHYLFTTDDICLETIGTYDDWPAGRGIFINDRKDEFGTFIVWVGEEDQMRIMAMNKGSDCIAVWDLFYTGLQAVHEGVRKEGHDFAFKRSHGYLSTCPTNLGTGMRASVHVNLPGFKKKQEVKDYVKELGMPVDIRGTHGESKNTDGITIYDVSNKERLGSDCFEQIGAMVDGVRALLEESDKRT